MKLAAFDPDSFIRPDIASLRPYTPIVPFEVLSKQLKRQPDDIVKLDANENPYGPSPLVAQALAEAPYLHIYPDPESRELRTALADYTGLKSDYILVGHGAAMETPEDAQYMLDHTSGDGFWTGSSTERLPIERAVTAAADAFTSLRFSK